MKMNYKKYNNQAERKHMIQSDKGFNYVKK